MKKYRKVYHAATGGSSRYVYIGTHPLQDFRCVPVDERTGITEENISTAISILR